MKVPNEVEQSFQENGAVAQPVSSLRAMCDFHENLGETCESIPK